MITRIPRCAAPCVNSTKSPSEPNVVVVADVVAVVLAWRFLKRHQPDRGDAEPAEIIEPAHQTLEIADAVGIRIHVSANRQTIKNGVLVPKVFDHPQCMVVVEMAMR